MYVKKINLKNFGNIKDLELDLSTLPNGIIAVAGENGSGKTHLLEALFAVPLYRKLMYYGDLVQEHFNGEGKVVTQLEFRGDKYTSVIEGKQGKTPMCWLYGSWDGTNDIAGPNVREFDAAIASIFPKEELLITSRCASQDDIRGFLGMSQADRHKAFASLLGTNEYDNILDKIKLQIRFSKIEAGPGVAKADKLKADQKELDGVKATIWKLDSRVNILGESKKDFLKWVIDEQREIDALRLTVELKVKHLKGISPSIRGTESSAEVLKSLARALEEDDWEDRVKQKETAVKEAQECLNAIWADAQINWFLPAKILGKITHQRAAVNNNTEAMVGVDLGKDICRECPLTEKVRGDDETLLGLFGEYQDTSLAFDKYIKTLNDPVLSLIALDEAVKQLDDTRGEKGHTLWQQWHEADDRLKLDAELKAIEEISETITELEIAQIWRIDPGTKTVEEYITLLTKEVEDYEAEIKGIEIQLAAENTRLSILEKAITTNKQDVELAKKYMTRTHRLNTLRSVISLDKRSIIEEIIPGIAAMTNGFLSSYRNGRYSIEFPTLQPNKVSGELKENFSPIVKDNVTGAVRKKVSGGEYVILAEALRMSFSIVYAKMLNDAGGTLSRDEAIANIDEKNIPAYFEVLRSGVKQGSFDQVLFVCHKPNVVEQADGIIRMHDGAIVSVED